MMSNFDMFIIHAAYILCFALGYVLGKAHRFPPDPPMSDEARAEVEKYRANLE